MTCQHVVLLGIVKDSVQPQVSEFLQAQRVEVKTSMTLLGIQVKLPCLHGDWATATHLVSRQTLLLRVQQNWLQVWKAILVPRIC